MAISFTGGDITAGTGAVIGAKMDVAPAIKALTKVAVRLLDRVTLAGMRSAAQHMLVDTGWARGHVGRDVDKTSMVGRFGILTPFDTKDGANVAAYPAMQNEGIRRHRVYLFDYKTGSLRMGLINWCERHGIKVWRTRRETSAKRQQRWSDAQSMYGPESGAMSAFGFGKILAKHYINVWGRAHPWLNMARNEIQAEFDTYLNEQQNSMEDEWMVGMS
jgi:hypothetical protein